MTRSIIQWFTLLPMLWSRQMSCSTCEKSSDASKGLARKLLCGNAFAICSQLTDALHIYIPQAEHMIDMTSSNFTRWACDEHGSYNTESTLLYSCLLFHTSNFTFHIEFIRARLLSTFHKWSLNDDTLYINVRYIDSNFSINVGLQHSFCIYMFSFSKLSFYIYYVVQILRGPNFKMLHVYNIVSKFLLSRL